MRPEIDFWFDLTCPYAYIASSGIEALAARTGAELRLQPFLLGGVFRARSVPQNLAGTLCAAKARHNANDLRRHAALAGVELTFPAEHPMRSVYALRAMLAAGPPYGPLMHAFYRAYWVTNVDISSPEEIAKVLTAAGHDADAVLARSATDEIKADLRARTDEAIALGVFGAPAMFLDGVLYWGNDRFDELERALGADVPELPPHEASGDTVDVDLWFDYACPFAFIAAERAARYLGDKVRFRPMRVTEVHQTVNPAALAPMSEAKSRYQAADFRRQSLQSGLHYRWPSRRPEDTDRALEVTLAADPDSASGRALVRRIFAAAWREDRDITDPGVLGACCEDVGLDARDVLARAETIETKNGLREQTRVAMDAGVFGAPTFVVEPSSPSPALYFGNDRLALAVRAARGEPRAR